MKDHVTDRQKTSGQTASIDTNKRLTAEIIRSETGEIYTQYRLNGRPYGSIEELPAIGGNR